MNLPRNPALTIATALLGAALALPAAADLDGAGDAASPVRAPHKVANRFHHQAKARETAEFARLEVATDEAGSDSRRAPHKAGNRFHHVD